jgi:uncharacterized protein YkwD
MRTRLAGLLLGLLPLAAGAQSLGEQVIELTNIQRWQNGQLPPLKYNAQLEAAATGHSTAMGQRNFFMHCDPDTGKQFNVRIGDAGYSYSSAAENIAAGNSTASATVTQWMNSAGHRANILSTNYNELGVGYYNDPTDTQAKRTGSTCTPDPTTLTGNYRHYWTQNFGRRSGQVLAVIAREAYQVSNCTADVYIHASGQAQMRFSNDGNTWSAWETFANNKTWNLAGALGSTATLRVETRTSGGTTTSASDTVRLGVACGTSGTPTPAARIFAGSFE